MARRMPAWVREEGRRANHQRRTLIEEATLRRIGVSLYPAAHAPDRLNQLGRRELPKVR